MLRRGFLRRSAVRCFKWDGGEKGNRMPDVVAAGTGATPAAFYLGLCRLRGILSLPASATVILQEGRSSAQLRWCCRRAVLSCSSDDAASIPKSGPEIKNRCTQQCINGEILASILKSASRGFDSGGRAGADAPGGGISLCFCRRGCAAPAQKAATLNDHCRRGQSMERTVRCLPETVKWMFIPAKLRPYTL